MKLGWTNLINSTYLRNKDYFRLFRDKSKLSKKSFNILYENILLFAKQERKGIEKKLLVDIRLDYVEKRKIPALSKSLLPTDAPVGQ